MSNSKRKFDSSSDEESDSEDEDYNIKNKSSRKKR